MDSAGCKGNWELFCYTIDIDAGSGGNPSTSSQRSTKYFEAVGQCKEICRTCPVFRECQQYVDRNPNQFGVWAGTTRNERRKLRASRSVTNVT